MSDVVLGGSGDLDGLSEVWSIVKERVGLPVIVAEVGSSAYGLNVGASDRDYTAVWLPTYTQLVRGIPERKQIRTAAEGERSGPDDVDINVYSISKFTHLVCKGNPSILATLYAPGTTVAPPGFTAALAEAGRSKAALSAFLGYANRQAESIVRRGGRGRVSRPELIAEFGYDVKFAAHAVRLTLQGIYYAHNGAIPAPMPEPDRTTVVNIRRGEWALDHVEAFIGDRVAKLREVRDSSPWPDHPSDDIWDVVTEYCRQVI